MIELWEKQNEILKRKQLDKIERPPSKLESIVKEEPKLTKQILTISKDKIKAIKPKASKVFTEKDFRKMA